MIYWIRKFKQLCKNQTHFQIVISINLGVCRVWQIMADLDSTKKYRVIHLASHPLIHQLYNFSSLLSISYHAMESYYRELNSHHLNGSWAAQQHRICWCTASYCILCSSIFSCVNVDNYRIYLKLVKRIKHESAWHILILNM